jgi:DNA-binding MarR family transcriptional regulator
MSGNLSFNKIFSSIPRGQPKHVVVGLTTLGKTKSESSEGEGVEFKIMADLADNGASSIREISNRTNIDDQKVKHNVKILISKGMVRKMDSGEE